MNSGDPGTGATCHEVVGSPTYGQFICGNFVAPRTFTVNNVSFDCAGGAALRRPQGHDTQWDRQSQIES